MDSSSCDACEALAWEEETQSCVTFKHSRETHTHRVFVSGAGGRTLSSALILVPTVNMADPQSGGLPPRVTLGRGFNGAQMNKYMNKSESREIIQQTATVVGSYSKQYFTLKLQFLHTHRSVMQITLFASLLQRRLCSSHISSSFLKQY